MILFFRRKLTEVGNLLALAHMMDSAALVSGIYMMMMLMMMMLMMMLMLMMMHTAAFAAQS